ncbi:peptidase S8/S53 subtilisin kexin sedolisin [Fictibacillus macauensis ZFHKF-1]|uniref:Peptidase S8/S53 subtilisin kexin sedolisin n=1 Tax=Fictibacillus macauensis ZFHKF-1 TaxID=1196324 RepID=I8UH83_9BACL|nr:S8 family peptidase [Fictibacillus macauensis]EIT86265.1 peptidase S8/S53 subtilisin kexin sedolisin [Fictibacillus macauensis ZFHKF-1]
MKLCFSVLLSTLIFISLPTHSTHAQSKDRYYIELYRKSSQQSFAHHANVNHVFTYLPALSIYLTAREAKRFKANPAVKTITKEKVFSQSSQKQSWGYRKLGFATSYHNGLTGEGVKVAVLDTGIDRHHKDLKVRGGVSFISKSYNDDNGHGTHIAGIIAAQNNTFGVIGVAPNVQLYAVKVLDEEGEGYESDVIAGIEWCIQHKMDIINLSLGDEGAHDLTAIVKKATAKGLLLVAAAGNDGKANHNDYPAKFKEVLSVGSIDENRRLSSFSNRGKVDVVAPGDFIYSTYANQSYAFMSGTSMAAPFVTGTLALLKQAHPLFSASELRKQVEQDALDLGARGKDSSYGYGLIRRP